MIAKQQELLDLTEGDFSAPSVDTLDQYDKNIIVMLIQRILHFKWENV